MNYRRDLKPRVDWIAAEICRRMCHDADVKILDLLNSSHVVIAA